MPGADAESKVFLASRGVSARRLLPALLDGARVSARRPPDREVAGVLGWGAKANTVPLRRTASQLGVPYIACEDGFIRSIGLGVAGAEPFGFVLDRTGIYYDATRPNDLETMIAAGEAVDGPRCRALMARIAAEGVSKYNHTWAAPELPPDGRRRVLLVDQTRGDLSVALGLADEASFQRMAGRAAAEHPGAELLVKVHPDVLAGKRRGYLHERLPRGCHVLEGDWNPQRLLAQVDHVYVVTSQLGIEALIAGKPVSCFGMPFYAGWGLTRDDPELVARCGRRGARRSLAQVFWAAYGRYTRYVDPIAERVCELETVLDRIADHRRVVEANAGRVFCFGFQWWKRPVAARFLGGPRARVEFARSSRAARRRGIARGDRIVVWGMRGDAAAADAARELGIPVERLEDGFLRSVGLGSDLVRPSSLILDRRGIYFDARGTSDLETLLAGRDFTEAELARGRALIERLRSSGITKYNTGKARTLQVPAEGGRRRILVPGQVEDDASIVTGCVDIRTNGALLEAARAAEPDAFLVYKPHPDVVAGNRRGTVDPALLARCADRVVVDCDMAACLRAVDGVHTLTSLTGFEALIHGKQVSVHGMPFYAGWGLTRDRHRCERRGRTLALEALVVAALALYPRYLHWRSGLFTGPEAIIAELERARVGADPAVGISRLRRMLRKLRSSFLGH